MNLFLSPAPQGRGRLLRFVVDHNPFYLLSAVCMLSGLLTLTNSLSYSPIPARHLLLLIATLNGYELLLVALSLWLIVRRKLLRDGAILLGIEALFLADTAMLNAELFSVDRRLGAIVNLLLLLLAAAKLAVIFRALRIRSIGAFVLTLSNLLLLFALPGIFKQISTSDNGRLSAMAIYAAWWAVGLLPIGFACVFHRPDSIRPARLDRRPKAHPRIALCFVLFSFASILVHLRLMNWVYAVQWEWANLSPLVLGMAVAIGMLDSRVQTLPVRSRLQLILPMLAIALSTRFAGSLFFAFGPLQLSPLRLAFAGATAVYLHGFWLYRHMYFAIASAFCLALIGAGASWESARQNLVDVWNWLVAVFERRHPRSAHDWGVLSVIASFVLLLAGAAASILKGVPTDEEEVIGNGNPDVPPIPPAHA
jgi:hypothetical protein